MASKALPDHELEELLQQAEARLVSTEPTLSLGSVALPLLVGTPSLQRSVAACVATDERGAHIVPSALGTAKHQVVPRNGHRMVDSLASNADNKDPKHTAGVEWYDLPRTVLTPELKRDLQLIRNRGVLDPHRHYKKESKKPEVPEFSQVGTVIQGPTEYFSARLSNKERKQTLLGEVLERERATGRFKAKYAQIQAKKTSGRKNHYKMVKAMLGRVGQGAELSMTLVSSGGNQNIAAFWVASTILS